MDPMTGPEHYRKAEEFLLAAEDADPDAKPADVAMLLQFAQVHATLAQAAATALNDNDPGIPACDYKAWYEVAGMEQRAVRTVDDGLDDDELEQRAALDGSVLDEAAAPGMTP